MIFILKRYFQIYEPLSLPIVIPDQPVTAQPVPLEPLIPATLADPTGANLTCGMMCSARVLPTVLLQQPGRVQLLQVPRFPPDSPHTRPEQRHLPPDQMHQTPDTRHRWRETLCGEGEGAWRWSPTGPATG